MKEMIDTGFGTLPLLGRIKDCKECDLGKRGLGWVGELDDGTRVECAYKNSQEFKPSRVIGIDEFGYAYGVYFLQWPKKFEMIKNHDNVARKRS